MFKDIIFITLDNLKKYSPPTPYIPLTYNKGKHIKIFIRDTPKKIINLTLKNKKTIQGPFKVQRVFSGHETSDTQDTQDTQYLYIIDNSTRTFTIKGKIEHDDVPHRLHHWHPPETTPGPKLLSKIKPRIFPLTDSTSSHQEYRKSSTSISDDITKETNENINDLKNKCKKYDSNIINIINESGNTNYTKLLKTLVKNEITCCDNVDMEEFVLKSSIVPCSNLIPNKYKDYGKQYDPIDGNVDEEDYGDYDTYPAQIKDKFSIIFISFIIFVTIIIMMNIL